MTGRNRALTTGVVSAALLCMVTPYAFSQNSLLNRAAAVRLSTIMSTGGNLAASSVSATSPLGQRGGFALDGSWASAQDWTGLAHVSNGVPLGGSNIQLETGVASTAQHGSTLTAALRVSRSWFNLDITAGIERAAQMEPSSLPSDNKPFVLRGTVHAPGTPHDTLSVQEAAERIARRNKLAVHGVITPVLQIASADSPTRWAARVGVPSSCCTWMSAAGSSRRPWAELSIERALTARVDLLGDIGTRQRFSARPAAVGSPFLRVGVTFHRVGADTAATRPVITATDAGAMFSFSVLALDSLRATPGDTTLSDGQRYYLIRSWAPRASSVRIRGDFSEWQTIELTRRSGGLWEIRLPLAPGFHSLSVQVNDGEWNIPPGMAKGATDYDDHVGIFLTGAKGE